MTSEITITGIFSAIKADIAALVRPSQFKSIISQIPCFADVGAMRNFPISVRLRTYDDNSLRLTFGYEGKPPLATRLIGTRGGVS